MARAEYENTFPPMPFPSLYCAFLSISKQKRGI